MIMAWLLQNEVIEMPVVGGNIEVNQLLLAKNGKVSD